jgi:hypothetical protein
MPYEKELNLLVCPILHNVITKLLHLMGTKIVITYWGCYYNGFCGHLCSGSFTPIQVECKAVSLIS